MSEAPPMQDRHKRKRKKSFLKNARKYGKRGCYGRGSQLDSDTYQYLIGLLETFRAGFPSEEEKLAFANNAFEEAGKDQLVDIIGNQVGCRVIEQLLPFANDTALLEAANIIYADIRRLSSDRFASHVIEALLTQTCQRSLVKQEAADAEVKKACFEFTLKMSRFLLNNLEEYFSDTYANHICRSVLSNLSQLDHVESVAIETIPEEYKEIVKDFGERLILWPQFKEMPTDEITSGFLQVQLRALKRLHPKLLKKYLKKLLEECFVGADAKQENSKTLPIVFMSKPAMMLLETALQVATAKMYTQIYAMCFVGHLVKLAAMRSTNFTVQKLLSHCEEKVEFEAMFDELQDSFGEILESGHSGVLLALAQTCKRLATRQNKFIQYMMQALQCNEPAERQDDFVLCMSRLTPYEKNKDISNEDLQKEKLNLHGTLMLQAMLEFNKPIKIITSIFSMEAEVVKNLFSNSMGSHIVDSFVKSEHVGEKSREKLIKKLEGFYQELAGTKYGSRAFEALWSVANQKMRFLIMDELCNRDSKWLNSEFGSIITNKLNLVLYKRNKENWTNFMNKGSKVDSLLKIIE